MMQEYKLTFPSSETIVVEGRGSIGKICSILDTHNSGQKWVVLTQKPVYELYGRLTIDSLRSSNFDVEHIIIPENESAKTFETAISISRSLIKMGCGRDSVIIGMGGGTVGDVAGFIASIYMRGVKLIQVPTTLLSMVDSSIGGKTAINVDSHKNIVGSFYHPQHIIIDPHLLNSLDNDSFISGLAEVVKYGIALDKEFFSILKSEMPQIILKDESRVDSMISRCIGIKSKVVMGDEKDYGLRMKLNFGHTFGHAFESETKFKISHGHAVALGMKCASALSKRHGLSKNDFNDIIDIIDTLNFPIIKSSNPEDILLNMRNDKKVVNGSHQFILVDKIGSSFIKSEVSRSDLLEALGAV